MNFIILIKQFIYKGLQLNLHNRITVSLQEISKDSGIDTNVTLAECSKYQLYKTVRKICGKSLKYSEIQKRIYTLQKWNSSNIDLSTDFYLRIFTI